MRSRHPESTRQHGMCCSVRRILPDRVPRVLECLGDIHVAKIGAEKGDLVEIALGEGGIHPRELRIELHRAREKAAGHGVLCSLGIREMPHSAVVAFPGVQTFRRLERRALALAALDPRLDRLANARGDLVLHQENVGHVAVVVLGPDLSIRYRVDEPCRHPDAVAGLSDTAFEHIAHAELATDILDGDHLALVGEGGVAGDHEQRPRLGQGRQDVFGDAVREILLLRIAGRVGKGEHGDARSLGEPRRRLQGRASFIRLPPIRRICRFGAIQLDAHVADKAQALARNRTDQLLVLAIVADRLARSEHAAGQGRLRNDPAAPDRGDEIVPRDDTVAILQQENQQIQNLRLDGNGVRAPVKLTPVGIEHMIGKQKSHAAAPTFRPTIFSRT